MKLYLSTLTLVAVMSLAVATVLTARGVDNTYIPPLPTEVETIAVTEELTQIDTEEVTQIEVIETQEELTTVEGEVVESIITPVYDYTDWELDLLARLIHAESGTESYDTKLKIGSVVMNRVDSDSYPNSIYDVIYQDIQFSVTFVEKDGVPMIDLPASEE